MKWTPDDHGCIYDEAGCFARLTPNKAERLASRHNADIDALTAERAELQGRIDTACERLEVFCAEVDEVEAERDELQRRLDKIRDWAVANEEGYPLGAWIVAIAEGREG